MDCSNKENDSCPYLDSGPLLALERSPGLAHSRQAFKQGKSNDESPVGKEQLRNPRLDLESSSALERRIL